MKTNMLKKILGTALVLTIAAGAFAPAVVLGAETIKGAQKLMTTKPPVSERAVAPASKCGGCKTEATVVTRIEKGHIKDAALVATHLCPVCKTSISVTGHGKAKKDVAAHSCGAADKGAACCGAGM